VSLEDLENYRFEAHWQAARAQLETVSDELRSLAAVSPRAELGARQAHPVSGDGIGPGEGFPGSRSPSCRPPTRQGSSSRRGPRRSRMLCSLLPVDILTAGTSSTALSADSALTAFSAYAITRVAVCSVSSSSVMSSFAPPATAARARPGPNGRERPAANGRADPFRFRKEHSMPAQCLGYPSGFDNPADIGSRESASRRCVCSSTMAQTYWRISHPRNWQGQCSPSSSRNPGFI
jgi:hypothetical protein